MPWWLRVASTLRLARILRRLRYDTRHLPAVERPSDDDGLRMLALARPGEEVRLRAPPHARRTASVLDRGPRVQRDARSSANRCPRSDRGRTRTRSSRRSWRTRFRTHRGALETLWDEPTGSTTRGTRRPASSSCADRSRPSCRCGRRALRRHAATRLDRAARATRRSPGPSTRCRACPLDAPQFEEVALLEGPDLGEHELDHHRGPPWRTASTSSPSRCGARTSSWSRPPAAPSTSRRSSGDGHGADDFSWTAALTIDLASGPDTGAEGNPSSTMRTVSTSDGTHRTPIPHRVRVLLEGTPIAFMTTIRPDGRLSTNPVSVLFDGGHLRVSTVRSRKKVRNLEADDRVTLCVVQPGNLNRYVEIHGPRGRRTRRRPCIHQPDRPHLHGRRRVPVRHRRRRAGRRDRGPRAGVVASGASRRRPAILEARCRNVSTSEEHTMFDGRVAVVTGSGSGIGRASALAFAKAGAPRRRRRLRRGGRRGHGRGDPRPSAVRASTSPAT